MVLSEGKGVGQGSRAACPLRACQGKQHPPAIPTPAPADKQTHPFHSGPWASLYLHSGGWGSTILLLFPPHPLPLPQAPGLWPGPPGIASGWKLMEVRRGSARL